MKKKYFILVFFIFFVSRWSFAFPSSMIEKADEFAEAGLYTQAASYYLEALNTSEHNKLPYIKYQLAQTYSREGKSNVAIQLLEEIISSTPSSEAYYNSLFLLGSLYKDLNNLKEAKKNTLRYLSETPKNFLHYKEQALFLLGYIDLLNGNYDEALNSWQPLSDVKNQEIESQLKEYLALIESIKIQEKDNTNKSMISSLKNLGALHYRSGNFAQAEEVYLKLAQTYPESMVCGEAWFWAAQCAQHLKRDSEVIRERKKNVYEQYPNSPYAAEAFFSIYTLGEYLQGDRTTIKHLQSFTEKYLESPFLIEAYYLLGMDLKRDRKTIEGKWIRKKNLTDAIEAFNESENSFIKFSEKNALPDDLKDYFSQVRLQATLERALINLSIANDSVGAKKKIYLEYADEVFKGLVADVENTRSEQVFTPLYEEALFGHALTKIKSNQEAEAKKILSRLLVNYDKNHITQSYYLSRVWYELGMIAFRNNQPLEALQSLTKAEEASKGNLLSTDQKLDLWIQQALCQRLLGKYDECHLLLSKTVNDDAVSSLRLKAMYLRAETYDQQGRYELARKQLESLAKKGGHWGNEAKIKMTNVKKVEENHGN